MKCQTEHAHTTDAWLRVAVVYLRRMLVRAPGSRVMEQACLQELLEESWVS